MPAAASPPPRFVVGQPQQVRRQVKLHGSHQPGDHQHGIDGFQTEFRAKDKTGYGNQYHIEHQIGKSDGNAAVRAAGGVVDQHGNPAAAAAHHVGRHQNVRPGESVGDQPEGDDRIGTDLAPDRMFFDGYHRGRNVSEMIRLKSSVRLRPMAAACLGMMLPALMPGTVLISIRWGTPRRMIKSTRATPRHRSVR